MNKSWITLIGIAILTLLAIVGYEFYLSLTGVKSTFSKPSLMILEEDLGIAELEYIETLEGVVLKEDSSLDK